MSYASFRITDYASTEVRFVKPSALAGSMPRAVTFLRRVDVRVLPVGPDGLGLFGIWFLALTGVCSIALKFSLPA